MSSVLIIGASGALGAAFVSEYRRRLPSSTIYATNRSALPTVDADQVLALDYDQPHMFADVAAQLADVQDLETILVATGRLHDDDNMPEKALKQVDADWMLENFRINTVGPTLALKHFLPLQPKTKPTRFGILSARVGSISDNHLGGWHSYRASKAALNMIIKTTSIEQRRSNPEAMIVGLHPGTVDSELSRPFQRGVPTLFSPQQSAGQLIEVLSSTHPEQSGSVFAFDGTNIPS